MMHTDRNVFAMWQSHLLLSTNSPWLEASGEGGCSTHIGAFYSVMGIWALVDV
jgi:hypothetical protein